MIEKKIIIPNIECMTDEQYCELIKAGLTIAYEIWEEGNEK